MTLKELKRGEFFTKKPIDFPNDNQVFIKSDYDRTSKKYACIRFSDCNDIQYIKGNKEIYTEFTF